MKTPLSDMLAQVVAELLSVPREAYTPGARRKLDDLRKLFMLDADLNHICGATKLAQSRQLVSGALLH